jgi:CPA2 family monovalent cation:H+ antiporter-2
MLESNVSLILIELGVVVIGLALIDRLARRIGISAIPLYLVVGLAFGNGGLLPIHFSSDFLLIGTEIGVLLLLFTLGLEYTGEQLSSGLRQGLPDGVVDFLLSFPPGFAAGLLLGWGPLAAWVLGGVTYISSSSIIAKILSEQGWLSNIETPCVVNILVFEDLVMALFLPLTIVFLAGQSPAVATVSIVVAILVVAVMLFAATHYGEFFGKLIAHESDEVVLFTLLGLILLVSGAAQRLQISAPVGAFLVGVTLQGPIADRARRILSPLRDLFAAIFFLFFGLQIDPATLPPVLLTAVALGVATTLTKLASGWWSAHRAGAGRMASLRAGSILVTRGEFSILIAELGVSAGLDMELSALTAAYVLFLSITGPILAQLIKPLSVVYHKMGKYRVKSTHQHEKKSTPKD